MKGTLQESSKVPSQIEESHLDTNHSLSDNFSEKQVKRLVTILNNTNAVGGEVTAEHFRDVCNERIKGSGGLGISGRSQRIAKCYFVHHFDPYLKLSPFHIEVKLYVPFRSIIHDFFVDRELEWMIAYSKPRLSATRIIPESTLEMTKSEHRYKDSTMGYTVSKTVQTWFNDIVYTEKHSIKQIREENETLVLESLRLDNPYNFTIVHDIMLSISKRIELVTHFNVTKRDAASSYQTTNYGLSGLVEVHHDAWGYESGIKSVSDRASLSSTGDYIGTFMGWLEHVPGGGATAFPYADYEGIIEPTKGSAAFWINLSSCHFRDNRANHGGCPVIKGSKWILNKWINSFDQWKDWPCYLTPYATIRPFDGMST